MNLVEYYRPDAPLAPTGERQKVVINFDELVIAQQVYDSLSKQFEMAAPRPGELLAAHIDDTVAFLTVELEKEREQTRALTAKVDELNALAEDLAQRLEISEKAVAEWYEKYENAQCEADVLKDKLDACTAVHDEMEESVGLYEDLLNEVKEIYHGIERFADMNDIEL